MKVKTIRTKHGNVFYEVTERHGFLWLKKRTASFVVDESACLWVYLNDPKLRAPDEVQWLLSAAVRKEKREADAVKHAKLWFPA